MTENEMVGWHHRLNGHEFEQTPGDGEGQRSLVCCSPWGHKELDMTEQEQLQLQLICLENSMNRGAWWSAVHGVAKSWTRLSDLTLLLLYL